MKHPLHSKLLRTASVALLALGPAPALAAQTGWAAGVTERSHAGTGTTTLREVRVGQHRGFDRGVWEFAGGRVPGYRILYVDRPVRQCGSGHPVQLAGQGWLEVRLTPAQAHDDQGKPTVRDRERTPKLPLVRQLKLTCDFEGDVTWTLGVARPNRYRVLELSNPARLVVDIRR